MKGGTLQIGAGGSSGSIQGNVNVDQAAQLAFNGSDDIVFEGAISGEGDVAQKGSGNLILSGENSFSGDLNVSSGTVTAGNDGTVFGSGNLNIASDSFLNISSHSVDIHGLSGSGNLNLGAGKLSVNLSNDANFSGNVTGEGSFVKRGTAALILSGASDYSGDTTISEGALRQGAEGALLDSGAFTDVWGSKVDLERDSSFLGRIGLSVEYNSKWQTTDGRNARSTAYLITNFYREFEASRNIRVSGTKIKNENQSNWMEIGSGIDVSWADEKYAIYGQGSVSAALEDASSNYLLKGNAGFKLRW
ncbi:autotransporter-associated beta strand repeat-containing protein [Ochrobactrum sp. Marseille-Q0166]|uniref:autotransporter-associated beta strand repeat-containing protein n=1 Tax=Ochrobactrum sp. Marseille-Q0166 TaxID=2761105 RepID=UPI0032B37E52